MRNEQKSWLSFIAGEALLTLFGLSLLAHSGLRGMAFQAAKAPAKKGAPQEEVLFPHMDRALAHLRAAQHQLQEAKPWFGGHREKALEHVNVAIADVQAGITEYMAKHPSTTRNEINPENIEVKMGYHYGEAQRLIQQAQEELNKAAPIFYGKREDALNQVKAALAEMKEGAAYYNAHPHNK